MTILDPKKLVSRRKVFFTSKFPKLDRWNKTRIYPNPITYRKAFEDKRNPNFTIPQVRVSPTLATLRSREATTL